jgi:FAD/FMN-containing dehydrogenase
VVSHTGAGGLILGGGLGRLQRRHGLAIDNVLGVELVTADGRVVRASADENPDLYWAVRGGGGNFGIVTQFFLRLHPVPAVVGNFLFTYPEAAARDALRRFFEFSAGADRDLFVIASAFAGEDGTRGVRIVGNWFGAPGRLDSVVAPLRKAGTATAARVFPAEYVKVQQAADAGLNAAGNRHYGKGGFVRQVDDALVDAILGPLEPLPGRNFSVALLPMDGAVADVAADATPWAHRDARFNLDASSSWAAADAAADARNTAANRAYWRSVEPFTRGFYSNGLLDENQAQVDATFGPNHARLVAAKRRWDPGNLFRLNANVPPGA